MEAKKFESEAVAKEKISLVFTNDFVGKIIGWWQKSSQ